MIGGSVGALLGAMFHIGATSYGVTGIPGFLITLDYTFQYAIILAVAFVISFGLTWMVWKEDGEEGKGKAAESAAGGNGEKAGVKNNSAKESAAAQAQNAGKESGEKKVLEAAQAAMDKMVMPETVEEKTLYVPVKGNIIARESIPDETFASGVLGDGVGIEPEVGLVVAPCDGEIASLTDTRHAIGMTTPGGMEILIHVGIDTVNMQGDGFTLFVSQGEKVKAGQKLLTFDMEKIKAAGYSTTTAVLVANSFMFPDFSVKKTGKSELMEKLISAGN